MYDLVENLTSLLGVFTLLGHIGLLVFLFCWMFRVKAFKDVFKIISQNALLLGFLISSVAVLMSLFYSEYAGYAPCSLCWWQRIFIYPQLILYAVALKKSDFKVANYTLPLAVIGIFIAIYNYALQMLDFYGEGSQILGSCEIGPNGLSCSEVYFLEFGYITMPLMSVTALAYLIVVALMARKA